MSDRIRCRCQRCTIRGLMGPVVVVTVGVLFLLQEMRSSDFFSFGNTYPVIIIVIGIISLATALASGEGHLSDAPAPPPAIPPSTGVPPSPAMPPASSSSTPSSFSGQGQ